MRRSRFLISYLWVLVLLVGAWLATTVAATITILVLTLLYAALIALRERHLSRIVTALADTLSLTPKLQAASKSVTSVSLQRSINKLHMQLLTAVIGAELFIFVVTLLSGTDVSVARSYAVLVLICLAPIGPEIQINLLLRSKHHQLAETARTALLYAAEDARTLLCITLLSFIGSVWLKLPPALSVMTPLIITCVARPLLSGRALQVTPHRANWRWRSLFMTICIYGSFLFFFIRHYLSPAHLDFQNPLALHATTVTLVVFIACQAAFELLNPSAPAYVGRQGLLLLFSVLVIVYLPLTQHYFMVRDLSPLDWLCSLVAGLVYVALCLLQQRSARHSHKAVIELHRARL